MYYLHSMCPLDVLVEKQDSKTCSNRFAEVVITIINTFSFFGKNIQLDFVRLPMYFKISNICDNNSDF